MMRTVHRFKKIFFLTITKFKGGKLAVAIIRIVAAGLIKIYVTDMRSNNGEVSSFFLFITEERFKSFPENSSFRKPNRKPRSYFLREHEKFKFFTKPAVIPFFSFFKKGKVIFKHFLFRERNSVYPLKLFIFFISAPV